MDSNTLFPENWRLTPIAGNRLEALRAAETSRYRTGSPLARPPYLSPFAQQYSPANLSASTIARHYFYRLPVEEVYRNIFLVKEPECATTLSPIKRLIYREQNALSGFQVGEDQLLYQIYIYISTDGNKLQNLYECTVNQIGDHEIYFFLEDNTNDFSDQVLLARFGKEVDKKILLEMADADLKQLAPELPDFNTTQLRELIRSGHVLAPISPLRALLNGALWATSLSSLPGKAVGWLGNQVGELIATLMIPENYWNSQSETYFLNREQLIQRFLLDESIITRVEQLFNHRNNHWLRQYAPQFVQQFQAQLKKNLQKLIQYYNQTLTATVHQLYDQLEKPFQEIARFFYLSESIALWCGLWNGLIDFVAGTFKLIGLFEISYTVTQNFQTTLESFDNLLASLSEISLTDLFFNGLKIYFDLSEQVITFVTTDNPRAVYNFDKIAYFSGFGIANIATALIPLSQLHRISNIAQVGDKLLLDLQLALTTTSNRAIKNLRELLLLLEEIGAFLAKKGEALYAELRKILDRMVDWLKKNSNHFIREIHIAEKKLLNEVDAGLLKLDELPSGKKRKSKDYTRYSNYGEIKARVYLESHTFKIGHNQGRLKYISNHKITDLDSPIRTGIDALYEFSKPPSKYLIVEVKTNTTGSRSWRPKLDTKITASGDSQMTSKWIGHNLQYSVNELIIKDININGFESLLIGVSKEHPIILKSLDNKAKILPNKLIKSN